MRLVLALAVAAVLSGCAATLPDGALPSSILTYYAPDTVVDLGGRSFCVNVTDTTEGLTRIACSKEQLEPGQLFTSPRTVRAAGKYLEALVRVCKGSVDTQSTDSINVDLQLLGAKSIGFGFALTYGYCQMHARTGAFERDYCLELDEKNPKSPLGVASVVWSREDARCRMASGSLKVLFTELLADIARGRAVDTFKSESQ